MSQAKVRLWGSTIGAVSLGDSTQYSAFQYDPAFARSEIEVSPIHMPLSNRVYSFSELPVPTFHGLPGLLADSLPDRFGHDLINAWLARQGRSPESFNAVERLCYIGTRGMGALEFEPATGPEQGASKKVEVGALVRLASEILGRRKRFQARLNRMEDILRVGTSAGGARAKALLAWNPETGEVRSGQVAAGKGFEYWVLKFDGVTRGKDREFGNPRGYGAIEYAYALMAKAAGMTMSECRLFEEGGRRHFMSRRFDRLEGGQKLHMQSLCALAHFDFNQPGAYAYEQAIMVMRQLGLPMESVEEQFRRMAFNIIARNQDDHVKNIAFLMDRSGRWSLAPAFDVTYSYNPQSRWVAMHQMTMNGKQDGFTIADFRACATAALMKRGRFDTILEQVRAAVRDWPDHAHRAQVPAKLCRQIQRTHRLEFPRR
jgi:serine/threonine-protein kinase HipA